jgi:hypothetical protein
MQDEKRAIDRAHYDAVLFDLDAHVPASDRCLFA